MRWRQPPQIFHPLEVCSANGFGRLNWVHCFPPSRIKRRGERTESEEDSFIITKLKQLPEQYNSSGLIVEQRMATSKDGTEIPYFIVMKEGMELTGKNPTLLYGYGGFEISLGPHYVATSGLAWLERGGVYVEANIRGGGEFGPSWHQAALKANRNKAYEGMQICCGTSLWTGRSQFHFFRNA